MNSALGAQEGQNEPKLALNWAQVGPSWTQIRPKLALSWLQGGSSPVSQVISCEAAAQINANQRKSSGRNRNATPGTAKNYHQGNCK